MASVTKDSIISSVWNNFQSVLSDNISSITKNNDETVSLKHITPAFSDKDFNSSEHYPLIILNSPSPSSENLTFGKVNTSGEIMIESMATDSQVVDKFADKIYNTIESNKNTLRDNGIKNIKWTTTESDVFPDRGGNKIHVRSLTFTWEFTFTKTERAY